MYRNQPVCNLTIYLQLKNNKKNKEKSLYLILSLTVQIFADKHSYLFPELDCMPFDSTTK